MKDIRLLKQTGFTFLDATITVCILAVLTTIALPNLSIIIQKNKQASQRTDVMGVFSIARSEAIKRGVRVVICPTSIADADIATCDPSVDWDSGWIAFVDTNSNNTREIAIEPFVTSGKALSAGYTLIGSGGVEDFIIYEANGSSLESGTLTLCDPRGEDVAQSILIRASGIPKASDKAAGGGALVCPAT